jgi:uncharacterized iron-regulated protein
MRRLSTFILALILVSFIPSKKDKNDYPAYKIYNAEGKEVSFSKMMKTLAKNDIVFIGELHDNPISHWMELEISKSLFDITEGKIKLGSEVFEADNQLILSEYLQDKIKENNFLQEMRLWPNYKTDYKPLVEFAKTNNLEFIATNVPRRYASMVYHKGMTSLDSLDSAAYSFLAPLPFKYDGNVACYKDMIAMMGGHGGDNIAKAQALKDATMAYFITENLKEDEIFIHVNGAYHSDNKEGIIWHLKEANIEKEIVSISTVLQDNVNSLDEENQGKADFILVVNSAMTGTH